MDKNFRIRLSVAFLLVSSLGLGVAVRAAYIMLVPSARLSAAMERQFRQEPPRMPRRGFILDRNRESLAVSLDVRSLFANPERIENKGQVAAWLAKATNLPVQQIRTKLKQDKGFIWIKRQLTQEEEAAVKELFSKHPVLTQVVGLAKESKRFYPNQNLASQIMGFTGLDSNGLEGVEFFYDKELAGISAKSKFEEGKTLVLTIDKSLQHTLEEELEAGAKHSSAKAATGILMDADTGDILAMASYPGYNPNQIQAASAELRRNRSVTDTYEPGSTMKPILLSGAMEWKAVTRKTKVFCEYGKMQIGNHWVREAEAKDKWGHISVGEVIQKSSNIGATKIGFLFGPANVYNWYRHMGINQKTNIDVAGEVTGMLPDYKNWSKILLSNVSFGQGVSVTPLQMLRAYAAFANGGFLVRPRLVKESLNAEGELTKVFPSAPKEKVMEPATVKDMSEILATVPTESGTAPKAAIEGFEVAGKTGTAQKAYPGHGYRSGKYISSFIGFVRNVKPNYVALVLMDEPHFPYFGGEAAAPVFRKVMTAALARAGVSPKEIPEQKLLLGKKDKLQTLQKAVAKASANYIESAGPVELKEREGNFTMPNLSGISAREVLDLFHRKDIVLKIQGSGTVVEQMPAPGASFKRGDAVSIRLNRSTEVP